MSYESAIIEALSLPPLPPEAPAVVQSARSQVEESLAVWRQMHPIANQNIGGGPSVSMFEDKFAQQVSIDLGAYKYVLAAAGLAADPMQSRRPMGTGWDFSTRHVPA